MISNFFSPQMRLQRYAVLVLAPTLLGFLYLAVIASDGYISRAAFIIQQDSPSVASPELALGLLSLSSGPSRQDALVVQNFLRSRSMLEHLQQKLDLRAHFSNTDNDLWARMDSEASAEEFLQVYLDHLHVEVDEESQISAITFTAYDPEYAQQVCRELVFRGEQFVNDINQNLAQEQLRFISGEVDKAALRMRKATKEMIALQRKNKVFSPEKESEAVAQILVGLEAELSRQQTELKALSGYLNPQAPDIIGIKQRISALQAQADQERLRLIGSGVGGLNDLALAYQDAEVNLRLAGEVYTSTLASLEATRLDAVRKAKYLIPIDAPSLPDSAELPRVGYWTFTIFVFLNLLYFVSGLVVATIQDHRE